MKVKPNKRLYTLEEAARYLGRSIWGIRGLIKKGLLSVHRPDSRIHLDVEDMDRFIEQFKETESN